MHSSPVCSSGRQYRFWPRRLIKTSLTSLLIALAYFWITHDSQQPSYIPDRTYKLTILNTSELNHEYASENTEIHAQLTQRQELINKIRNEVEADGGKLLLLSGGELSSDDDILNLRQLNQLGYNAMAVSPLLFDEPMNTIRTQEAAADFPFLSANLYESETGRPVFDAYALFDFDGLRVAVMGLTGQGVLNEDISADVAEHRRGIEIIDPVLAASELVPYLRRQADIVIVATHAINYPKLSTTGNQSIYLISKMDGIDLLVGNSVLPSDDVYRISEDKASLNLSSSSSSIRRIDLEFRNGELKKTNSVQINLARKIDSEYSY
ncbi:hypothetical protein [Endozoicomonas sp.]|uniref:hypothetical protein n=1 Tax=Endozoicomonas sp. TaxID=1892382 RepID=UPI00288804B3|nr:hypothetical protein [Endozoicomonas sp.]